MAERLKAHAWKACVGETLPWVRIPLSPPHSPPSECGWSEWESGCGPSPSARPLPLESAHVLCRLPRKQYSCPQARFPTPGQRSRRSRRRLTRRVHLERVRWTSARRLLSSATSAPPLLPSLLRPRFLRPFGRIPSCLPGPSETTSPTASIRNSGSDASPPSPDAC
jgi:hypothetical protein